MCCVLWCCVCCGAVCAVCAVCVSSLTLAVLWSVCQEQSLFFPRGELVEEEEGEWSEEGEEGEGREYPPQRSLTSPPLLEIFNRSSPTTDSLTSAKPNGPVEIQITAEIHNDSSDHSTQPRSPRGGGPAPRSPTREVFVQPSSPSTDTVGVEGEGGKEKTYKLRFSSFRKADDTFDDVV